MKSRGTVGALATLVLAMGLVACVPQPEPTPTPTPTGFASEAEAFAAAEETYRAYVDALNQVDLSDPDTFEAVYAWTTGELNASDKKNFTQWSAEGHEITGQASVLRVAPVAFVGGDVSEVSMEACYDINEVDVLDRSGTSIVSAERPSVQALRILMVQSDATPTTLAIYTIESAQDLSC